MESNVWLRTPPIDLTGITEATLTLQQWVDSDSFDDLDQGTIRILDANTLAEIVVLETGINGLDPSGWVKFSKAMPVEALDQIVRIEFQFQSDDFDLDDQSGWYLDDVAVTTPPM